MPRPTQQLSSLPPFSRQTRQSLDESSLPSIPHPPSPPAVEPRPTTAAAGAGSPLIPNPHRYSAIPLISSVTESIPNEEVESYYNNSLNTGVYNSLSRIPSYRLPSPVSLPSRHNSRIQRDRGMSASPVSSISISDAPITGRYSYLVQPLSGIPQSPSPPDMPQPPPPPPTRQHQQASTPSTSTMGAPPAGDFYSNPGQSSRATTSVQQLPPINESTSNLHNGSRGGISGGYVSQDGAPTAINPPLPPAAHDLQDIPLQHINNAIPPTPPRNTFQRMQDFATRQFNQVQVNIFNNRRPISRSRSISQFVRRHRRRSGSHPPTPALAIIGLVTSFLVFIALLAFLWVSTFAANIVAVVYSFSVLCACAFVLIRYNQKKRRADLEEDRGGSRLSLFRRSGGGAGSRLGHSNDGGLSQPEMDMVQESEIIVIPRLPVHRVVEEGEADPELPPYTRGDATEILDAPVAPIR
ncbi:hypothetical protein ABW19_dt0205866 [Dactylella cylindrospora]|nr:hypothetical protein ABW19_dt0205866 [Dactylella cylindrospora]